MVAAIATAVPWPCLALISLATESQTSCLREETTTLAPCSAIRSAMARPMPRVDPVMTATFPLMSNKVMRFLPMVRLNSKLLSPCPGRGAAFFMPLRRAGTVPHTALCYGPGSAAHHAVKNGALRCVRGTVFKLLQPGIAARALLGEIHLRHRDQNLRAGL